MRGRKAPSGEPRIKRRRLIEWLAVVGALALAAPTAAQAETVTLSCRTADLSIANPSFYTLRIDYLAQVIEWPGQYPIDRAPAKISSTSITWSVDKTYDADRRMAHWEWEIDRSTGSGYYIYDGNRTNLLCKPATQAF